MVKIGSVKDEILCVVVVVVAVVVAFIVIVVFVFHVVVFVTVVDPRNATLKFG